MDAAIALVIGLIIGWSLNWVIQPLLGRSAGANLSGLNETLADLQVRLAALESAASGDGPRILTVTEESNVAQVYVKEKDPLVEIVGIGPVYAQRLNEAGIYTFDEVARLSPGRLREIVAPEDWHEVDPEAWIQQARELGL
jgi:predicted flap endonuclease-1-like 5' DNA nuclease